MIKSKVLKWILILVALSFAAFIAVFGKMYYENRYVGEDYYSMVPLDYHMNKVAIRNKDGAEVGTGIEYILTAFNKDGESKRVSFRVYDPDSSISFGEKQPQPGDYLCIHAGKQIVIKWNFINRNDIPQKALDLIEKG